MRGNRASRVSLGYGPYTQFAHSQSCIAMPFSSDIAVSGLNAQSYGHSLSYQIRQSIDSIAYDILTQGKATRLFCLTDTRDCEYPHLFIVDCSRKEKFKEPSIASKKVVTKSSEFGIKQRDIKGMVRKLSHLQMPPSGNDFIRRSNLREMMADRAGSAVFWTLTYSSKFTDPFILISRCNQMILAIKICKCVEKEINDFLFEAKIEATVTVPTYSLTDLSNNLKAFVEGSISVNDFRDIVFKHDSELT